MTNKTNRGRISRVYKKQFKARNSRKRAILSLLVGGSLMCAIVAIAAPAAPSSGSNGQIFTDYTPLSSNAELARRMLSPLRAATLPEVLAQKGARLSSQPLDLEQESFALYVPAKVPSQGYGLIVFVPPWNAARLPDGWTSILDERGLIFVSAARSGNDQSVVGRRVPLAILAEQNVARRYHLDEQRIYIAGFSGGSRVALWLALAYPDLFRGAILNAGSDPIGTAAIPLPPRDLFLQFQEQTHLIYVTGDRDTFHVAMGFASMRSLRDWCVFNVEDQTMNFTDHEVISPEALSRALDALAKPATADPARLADCRAGIEAELSAKLKQVQSLITAGDRDGARDLLKGIDTNYGGFAAPQTVELERALNAPK